MTLDDSVTVAGQPADAETEAWRELRALAWKKTGSIPAEMVVRHVQEITGTAEWPVKKAALVVVLRRIGDLVGNKKALFTGLFDGSSDEVTFERSGTFLSRIERVIEKPVVADLGVAEEPLSEESTLADEAVADFSDAEAKSLSTDLAATSPAVFGGVLEGTAAAIPSAAVVAHAATPATALPPSAELAQLFAKLVVQREHDGSLNIKAPPEAATALATVFGGLAQMLSQAAGMQRD